MHQSKLLDLLRKLSPKQLSRAGDFVASPYFNKNQDNILFFNYLQKYVPDFDHKNLARETAVQKIATEKPLDEKSLAYLMSQLTKLLETFLAVENLLEDGLEMQLTLLKKYHLLGLQRYQKPTEDAIEKTLEKMPLRNADFHQKQLIFKRLQYEQSAPNQRGYNEKLQEASDALETYFLIEKLRYACGMQNLSNALHLDYHPSHASEAVDWAAEDKFSDEPAIQIYRRLFLLLSEAEEPGHFDEVKKLLAIHSQRFEPHELKQLYTLLLNYCTRRINRFNDELFRHEYLEINKLLLENGLIFENGHLPPWRYTNLVTVGLRTGQTDWTHDFIHRFRSKLAEEYAENLFRYNLAQFYYHQKDFDRAQRELVHVEFTDVLLNVSARSLLIKIYFETGQDELLLSYLEATRIFLLRNNLLDGHLKQQMKKFVEYCGKLVKAEGDAARLRDLREKLPSAQEVMHRDWLAAKLAER